MRVVVEEGGVGLEGGQNGRVCERRVGGADSPEQVVEEGGVDAGVDEEEVAQALREFVLGMRGVQEVREPTRRRARGGGARCV